MQYTSTDATLKFVVYDERGELRDHQSRRRFTFLNDGTVGCHFLWRSGTRNPLTPGQGSRPTLVSAKKARYSDLSLFCRTRLKPSRIFIDGG